MIQEWVNGCRHPDSTYLGWVQSGEKLYDVYIFPNTRGDSDVCARYGNEPHEYLGIGPVTDLIRSSYLAEEYRDITRFLLQRGTVEYSRDTRFPSL
jgi:hypothetical protein